VINPLQGVSAQGRPGSAHGLPHSGADNMRMVPRFEPGIGHGPVPAALSGFRFRGVGGALRVVCPRIAGRGGSVKPLPPSPQRAQDAVTARGVPSFLFWGVLGAFGLSRAVSAGSGISAVYGKLIPRNPHQGHIGSTRNDGVGGSSPPVGLARNTRWTEAFGHRVAGVGNGPRRPCGVPFVHPSPTSGLRTTDDHRKRSYRWVGSSSPPSALRGSLTRVVSGPLALSVPRPRRGADWGQATALCR
jgi:hypothetical protein